MFIMKRILLLATLAAFPLLLLAQVRPINQFYRTWKPGPEVKNFIVPGWLIDFAGTVAIPFVEEPETRAALRLARKVGKTRILYNEDGPNNIPVAAIDHMVRGARKKGYTDLVLVQDGATRVHVLVRENKNEDRIKGLLVLVSEEDTFMMVSSKMSLSYAWVGRLVRELLQSCGEPLPDAITHNKPRKAHPDHQMHYGTWYSFSVNGQTFTVSQ